MTVKYTNERIGFSVEIPDGWRVASEDEASVLFKEEGREFGPNVLVSADEIPEGLSLHEGGLTFFERQFEEQFPDADFGNEQRIEIDGREAIAFNVGYAYDTDDGQVPVVKMAVFVRDGTRLFSVVGTSSPAEFEEKYPTFQGFALTLRPL